MKKTTALDVQAVTKLLLNEDYRETLTGILNSHAEKRTFDCLHACRNIPDHALETDVVEALINACNLTLIDLTFHRGKLPGRAEMLVISRLRTVLSRIGVIDG